MNNKTIERLRQYRLMLILRNQTFAASILGHFEESINGMTEEEAEDFVDLLIENPTKMLTDKIKEGKLSNSDLISLAIRMFER